MTESNNYLRRRPAANLFASRSMARIFAIATAIVVTAGVSQLFAEPQTGQPTEKSQAANSTDQDANATHYTYRNEHDPNGIGKFYQGREIAAVMSFHGAPWLERASREEEEKLSVLVESLELKPGMTVADIGAGSGVVTLLLAKRLKSHGKVLAVDIQEEMLSLLRRKLEAQEIDNVELVLGSVKSPNLEPASVDLAILVDVYHEFAFPHEMMIALSRALKPGGRIALVEYRKEDPRVPIKLVHKMAEAQVKKELGQPEFGLQWKETLDVLPRQHIVVFERVGRDEGGE